MPEHETQQRTHAAPDQAALIETARQAVAVLNATAAWRITGTFTEPPPPDASVYDVLAALRTRYAGKPVPPCRVCGGKLTMQACGGGRPTEYACPRPDGVAFDDHVEHYRASRFIETRPADPEGAALVDALDAVLRAANVQPPVIGTLATRYAVIPATPDGTEPVWCEDPDTAANHHGDATKTGPDGHTLVVRYSTVYPDGSSRIIDTRPYDADD